MEETTVSDQDAIVNGEPTKRLLNIIARNINEAVDCPELFEFGLCPIKSIIEKSESIDLRTVKEIIRHCSNKYGDEGLTVIKYIKVENIGEEELVDILGSLETIPIIKESKRVINRLIESNKEKDKIIEELEIETESYIEVDWEAKFEDMKKIKEELEKEVEKLKIESKKDEGGFDVDWEGMYKDMKKINEELESEVEKLRHEVLDLKIKKKEKITPIPSAKEKKLLGEIKKRFSSDFDSTEKINFGNKVLIRSSSNGYLETAKFLVENGINIDAKDKGGKTALINASSKGRLDLVKYLVKKGANIEERDKYGYTAIIIASMEGHFDVVKYLLEKGAAVNRRDLNGETALIYASSNGNIEIVKYLIEKGANIDAKDNDGWNSLLWAIENKNFETVKFLIEEGVDVNEEDKNGETALTKASEEGQL